MSGTLAKVPKLKLSNGFEIPFFGLGTWKENAASACKDAIDLGYRHFDTARAYENEKDVGAAIKEKIAEGVVKREELFITSKLWSTFHRADLVIPILKKQLQNLELEYLDLYLIHWPVALKEGHSLYPMDGDKNWLFSEADFVDTWKEMEKAVKSGLVRSIGVSNFNTTQINRLLEGCTVRPVINQIECHPFLNQENLINFCKSKGIAVTGYSPLGSPNSPIPKSVEADVVNDPTLATIGEKYGKSAAQVALRWQIQRGVIIIPRSTSKTRIADNINIFDFVLDNGDMAKISGMNTNARMYAFDAWKESKNYPFNEM